MRICAQSNDTKMSYFLLSHGRSILFPFLILTWPRYSSAGPEATLEVLFGLTLCQVGEGYYRANVSSSGNELSRGAELSPHRPKSRGELWNLDTELLMTPFDRPSIRHAGLFINPWLYSISTVWFCSANLTLTVQCTAWPNNQLIKHLHALAIRKMKNLPT